MTQLRQRARWQPEVGANAQHLRLRVLGHAIEEEDEQFVATKEIDEWLKMRVEITRTQDLHVLAARRIEVEFDIRPDFAAPEQHAVARIGTLYWIAELGDQLNLRQITMHTSSRVRRIQIGIRFFAD